jgi:hypothetical protein
VRVERIGDCELWLGDARELGHHLNPRMAIVSDPPYGIGFRWTGAKRNGRRSGLAFGANAGVDRQPEWRDIIGDDAPFDPAPWLNFAEIILWGGNNYAGLPPSTCWLVWDKRRDTTPDNHGDAELAWTNLPGVIRVHRQVWRGIVREGAENVANEPKCHPTQKPVALMSWCVGMTKADTIADPYMGSGSTALACIALGRRFIGIELDERHFETACRRIEQAYRQPRLFQEPAPRPVQEAML